MNNSQSVNSEPDSPLEVRLRGALAAMADDVREDCSDLPLPSSTAAASSPEARWLWPALAAAAVVSVLGLAALATGGLGNPADSPRPAASRGPVASSVPTPSKASQFEVDDVAALLTAFDTSPGFGNVIVDYEAAVVEILWRGRPPADVENLVGPHPSGVLVTLRASKYSQADLEAAGKRVLQAAIAGGDMAGIVVAVPTADRSGLIAEVLPSAEASAQDIADVAGVPVQIRVVDEAPQPMSDHD